MPIAILTALLTALPGVHATEHSPLLGRHARPPYGLRVNLTAVAALVHSINTRQLVAQTAAKAD